MLKKRITVIEDEPGITELIQESLPYDKFIVNCFANGNDGIDGLKHKKPDALLLDWELPDISGPDIIRIIRKDKKLSTLPIIMLTVRKQTKNITSALDLGADEYITKPFNSKELCSRVTAILRRLELKEIGSDVIKRGTLIIHIQDRKVTVQGKKIDLTEKEYQLLYILIKNPGRTVSTDEIIERIWGYEYIDGDVIGSKIRVLLQRVKLKLGKKIGDKIRSKYSMGYIFEE
ncbi:MAG: response regulator transcription factor [bacterium]